MAFFDKVKGTFTNASDNFKMNNQMKENDRQIQNLLFQVGVQCYNTHGHETGTEYDNFFREIHRLREENNRLQQQITALAGKTCPQCGHQNANDSKFCVNCGAPLDNVPAGGQAGSQPGPQFQNGPQGAQQYQGGQADAQQAPLYQGGPVETQDQSSPEATNMEQAGGFSAVPEAGAEEAATAPETSAQEVTAAPEAGTEETFATPEESAQGDAAPTEAVDEQYRICPQCGARNDLEASFCIRCGSKIV